MTTDDGRHRLGLVAVTALSLFGALFARLWFLQVVEGPRLEAQATRNTTRIVVTPAPRGRILDRNGTVLVDDRESTVVAIEGQKYDLLADKDKEALLGRLAFALSADQPEGKQATVDFLGKRLNDARFSRYRPVPVAEDISPEQEVYLREQADQFPTVTVERQTVRSYPYGSLAAHVLGYVGPLSDGQWADLKLKNDKAKPYDRNDEIGKAGVEKTYESYLRGTPGQRVYEVNRSNRVVREIESKRVNPEPGDDLYLSIDSRVQYKAEAALQGRLVVAREAGEPAPAGAATVLDPDTGQVRAMASYPTYNPADLVGGISCPVWRDLQGVSPQGSCENVPAEIDAAPRDAKPVSKLLNRATQGSYPPASTFKLATAYAAVKLGIITPDEFITDSGSIRICKTSNGPGCVKHNSGNEKHDQVDLRKALTVSSDVYFYRIGDIAWRRRKLIGDDALQKVMEELGYGHRTGIDLPAESPGNLPTPASEAATAAALFEKNPAAYDNDPAKAKDAGRWRSGFSADLAIGQKVDATPLQIANAYAALANGGTLYQPTVLDHITLPGKPDVAVKVENGDTKKDRVIRQIAWGPGRDAMVDGFHGVVDPSASAFRGTAVTPFEGFPFGFFPLAGKTGTAQTGTYENGREKPDNSVFVAFQLDLPSHWVATAMLEQSGFGARAAAPTVRLILQPIADTSIDSFVVPPGGAIDAQAVAAASSGIGIAGGD